ncbi:hypothetical protein MPER_00168, partial [Moniliophthora perniciosa FA553]
MHEKLGMVQSILTFARTFANDGGICSGLKFTDVTFEDAYSSTKQSLLSHSADLRLSVLQFLASCYTSASTVETTNQVVQRCLQGEEVPLDVQGVRERVLRIGKIAQAVKDGDEVGAEVAARWLI